VAHGPATAHADVADQAIALPVADMDPVLDALAGLQGSPAPRRTAQIGSSSVDSSAAVRLFIVIDSRAL
jgi:hypothetical protein